MGTKEKISKMFILIFETYCQMLFSIYDTQI